MYSVMRSSVGKGTDVGAIMVAVAYESCEPIFKVACAGKRQREIEMQIIKRMSRADPNNTRLSVILRR